jgi:hypothetical protein
VDAAQAAILSFLGRVRDRLDPEDPKNIETDVAAGEFELALETICLQLVEYEAVLTTVEAADLKALLPLGGVDVSFLEGLIIRPE